MGHSYANRLGEHEAPHALFPSLFFSSYSLGTVLVEPEAPYVLIPIIQSSVKILLQMHWVSTKAPQALFPSLFFFLSMRLPMLKLPFLNSLFKFSCSCIG